MGCQMAKSQNKNIKLDKESNQTLSTRHNIQSMTPTTVPPVLQQYKEYDPNIKETQYKVIINGVLFDEIKPFEENYHEISYQKDIENSLPS